jgi:molybdopterin-guanine dinucleotide biosynthesis protein A
MCDKVKEDEKGGHVTRMGVEKCKQNFGGET